MKQEYFSSVGMMMILHLPVERIGIGQFLVGPYNDKLMKKVMADKDFEFYKEVIPRILFSIGIRNKKVGSIHSLQGLHYILSLPSFS